MSVAKRIGANAQYEIDMRNAKLKAFFDSKGFVNTARVLCGVGGAVGVYVLMCVASLMDQGVM